MQELLKLEDTEKTRLEEHLKVVLEKSRTIKKTDLEELKKDYGPKAQRNRTDIDSPEGEFDDYEEEDEEPEEDSDEESNPNEEEDL